MEKDSERNIHNPDVEQQQNNAGNAESKKTKFSGFLLALVSHSLFSIMMMLLLGLGIASGIIYWSSKETNSLSKATSTEKGVSDKVQIMACPVYKNSGQVCVGAGNPLCEEDMEKARIAWKYFENNYQKKTGLVNAADQYPSSTMWDTGSSLAATIAAVELGIITQKEFDDRVVAMLGTLKEIKLFNNEAPNKVYNTATGEMVDYGNNPSADGIGVSALDLARLSSWLNILACLHPKHAISARSVITRWKFCNLIKDGQMNGLAIDPVTKKVQVLQEGRLGYEQYAGKVFKMFGFDQSISATYKNQYATETEINGLAIASDMRDPRKLGAYNYVVTESYLMDAFEHGMDAENTKLAHNIFEVQKRRWQKTGQVTAVSEDNVDRKPYFVYNTIFAAGSPWNTITDTGQDMDNLKSISTKAALSLAFLYPQDEYSSVLNDTISSAYDPEKGWYSGVYEKGLGYNKAITSNTNGVILSGLLYKKYGPLNQICSKCKKGITLTPEIINAPENKDKCLPGSIICNKCTQ